MDCFVAAATGALKAIDLQQNVFRNLIPIAGLAPKKDEVTSMLWNNDDQTEVLAVQLDRQLKLFDSATSSYSTLFNIEGGSGPVKGMHITKSDRIITTDRSGLTGVYSRDGKQLTNWNVGPEISAMKEMELHNNIVTGGMGTLVKSWDLETGKQTWSAKNVPPDFLLIEQPISCTDLLTIPEEHLIVEATKLHEMRLYDPRAQRRPVKKLSFMDVPITCVARSQHEWQIHAANSIGEMALFDLRNKGNALWKYKGQAGSIRSISAHPTEPLFATCGIDRFVRVHNTQTRKLVHKIYCKTRLNRVLMRKDLSILNIEKKEEDVMWNEMKEEVVSEDSDNGDGSDSEGDDVWDDIECDGKEKSKKRKETDDECTVETKKKKPNKKLKRKEDEEVKDEITLSDDEAPPKKTKKVSKADESDSDDVVEIKEELDSDNEPEPPKKKKKVTRKTRKN